MSGRDSPEQEQREGLGTIQIDWAGSRTGPCLAETAERGSRERLILVFAGLWIIFVFVFVQEPKYLLHYKFTNYRKEKNNKVFSLIRNMESYKWFWYLFLIFQTGR